MTIAKAKGVERASIRCGAFRPTTSISTGFITALFRGWSAFIGLRIENSLLERSVEQELFPMASELGLGITPWGPLKSGALSGKYTRKNAGEVKADRGARVPLDEKTYTLVDQLVSSPRRTTAR
jgi:aryl-alcohol dehydrogenase-like predicted oxidoreductase